jgi:hypothetical protein
MARHARLIRKPLLGEVRRSHYRSCSGRPTWRLCLLRCPWCLLPRGWCHLRRGWCRRRWRCSRCRLRRRRCWTRRRCRWRGTPRCCLRECDARELRCNPDRSARHKARLDRGLRKVPTGQLANPLVLVPPAAGHRSGVCQFGARFETTRPTNEGDVSATSRVASSTRENKRTSVVRSRWPDYLAAVMEAL